MLTRAEIAEAVADPVWQAFRLTLLSRSTPEKLIRLRRWREAHPGCRRTEVQVENYLNALKRGGLVDSEGRVLR
jgi:hypothetical protein